MFAGGSRVKPLPLGVGFGALEVRGPVGAVGIGHLAKHGGRGAGSGGAGAACGGGRRAAALGRR